MCLYCEQTLISAVPENCGIGRNKVMPTYGYECKSCEYTFDAFQAMSDEPLKICPQCGKDLRRLINGGSGIIFKGSGFYVTDKKSSPGSCSPKPCKDCDAKSTGSSGASPCPAAASCADAAKKEKSPSAEKTASAASAGCEKASAS